MRITDSKEYAEKYRFLMFDDGAKFCAVNFLDGVTQYIKYDPGDGLSYDIYLQPLKHIADIEENIKVHANFSKYALVVVNNSAYELSLVSIHTDYYIAEKFSLSIENAGIVANLINAIFENIRQIARG